MALSPEDRKRIYEEEMARAEAQEQIKKEKNKKKGIGCSAASLIILATLVIAIISILLMSPDNNTSSTFVSNSKGVGKDRMLSVGGEQVVVGITKAAYDEFTKLAVANDVIGMANQALVGRTFLVDNNTKVLVIDRAMYKRKVRILDGEFIGRSGWVAKEWIR